MKTIKILSFSVILAGALSISANAEVTCSSALCIRGDIGAGGIYSDFSGGNTAGVTSLGGYGNLGFNILALQRIQLDVSAKLGGGSSTFSGSLFDPVAKNSAFGMGDFIAKLGFNFASVNAPVFLNVVADFDYYIGKENFNRGVGILGLELEGRIPTSQKNAILYSFGGGLGVLYYQFNGTGDTRSWADKASYAAFGSLGFSHNINDNVAVYIKAIGKYYNLYASKPIGATSVSYPSANSFSAMVQAGLMF